MAGWKLPSAGAGSSAPGIIAMTRGDRLSLARVAEVALSFSRLGAFARPALVNGVAGVVVARNGQPVTIIGLAVRHGKISAPWLGIPVSIDDLLQPLPPVDKPL